MEPGPIETILARLKQYFPVLVTSWELKKVCYACFACFIFTSQREGTKHRKISLSLALLVVIHRPIFLLVTTGAHPLQSNCVCPTYWLAGCFRKDSNPGAPLPFLLCIYLCMCQQDRNKSGRMFLEDYDLRRLTQSVHIQAICQQQRLPCIRICIPALFLDITNVIINCHIILPQSIHVALK